MKAIDLHVHSNCSDGTMTPSRVAEYAAGKGLFAIALTDHDTTKGIAEARETGEKLGLEVISGIELSCSHNGKDIHVLGLFIDENSTTLQTQLAGFQKNRDDRNAAMCEKIREYTGFEISLEAMNREFPGSILTRAHFARYLQNHGYTKSMAEGFDRYVGDHAPCYLPKVEVSPFEGVRIIRSAGGCAVLAHPFQYGYSSGVLEDFVAALTAEGLDGMECIYSTYSPSETGQLRALAAKYHLMISGGSDFHGSNKPHIDLGTGRGRLFIPADLLDDFRQTAQDRKNDR